MLVLALVMATAVPAGSAAVGSKVTLRGTLVVVHHDAPPPDEGLLYFLQVGPVLSSELRFEKAPRLRPGTPVEVTGTKTADAIAVSSVTPLPGRAAVAVVTTGTRKLLVILAEWAGSNPLATDQATANEFVFGTTDPQRRSTRLWYEDVSYDQLQWTGDVTPILTMADPASCNLNSIANKADAAATAAGYTLSDYDNRMYNFSDDYCGDVAFGDIAGPHSWISNGLSNIDDGYDRLGPAHELGHNLGEYHGHGLDCGGSTVTSACITAAANSNRCENDIASPCQSEYGNAYDVMGNNWTGDGYDGVNWFGIWHEMAFGWVNGRTTTDVQPSTAQNHSFSIAPIEQSTGNVGLIIDTSAGRRYVVEYRRPLGQDAFLSDFLADFPAARLGVLVSMRDPGAGYDPGPLNLDAMPHSITEPGWGCTSFEDYCDWFDAPFIAGQTFSDLDGKFTLTVDSASAAGADVTVHWVGGGGGGDTMIQETDPAVAYNGWRGVADAAAGGGTYRVSTTKNDKITWKSAKTTSLTWITRTGPDRGNANVTIDGASRGNVDLYAAAPGSLSKLYPGLANKAHTVVIKVLGTKHAASTGTGVALDAFRVGAATTQDSSNAVTYNTWKGAASASASGGAYRSAVATAARLSVSFTGTQIDWITAKGKAYGKAEVRIDGVLKGTVDLYQAAQAWKAPLAFGGLSAGPHTMEIRVLGLKNASATGTTVVVDGFVVHP